MTTIHYCNAPSGCGKTHQIVQRACRMAARGRRVFIIQPTKHLIDKTVAEELEAIPDHPPYRVFHGDTVEGSSIAKKLIDYLKKPEEVGQIIFFTHALLPLVRFWPNKDDWDLLVDEELQVIRQRAHRVPITHRLITDLLQVEPVNGTYGQVLAVDEEEVDEKGRNRHRDDLLELLAETNRTLANEHWETFVNLEQYERLKAGTGKLLAFHSVLDASVLGGFRSVFMASANFEDTALFQLWTERGVQFQEDRTFAERLRFTVHPNGRLVTIYFGTDKPWSRKRLQAVAGENGETSFELMVKAAADLFGEEPFLWQANKSHAGNPFAKNGQRLPNKPHGLNTFLGVHNIAFLSALNPPTNHFRFLETQGLTGGEVRQAIYFATAYQSTMRTSLRDPGNTEPKRILVPDRALAEYLHHLFPGSRTERLEIGLPEEDQKKAGRPRKHASNKRRTAAHRQRNKEKKLALLNDLFALGAQDTRRRVSCRGKEERCNENSNVLTTDFVTQLTEGTVYRAKNSSRPLGYIRHVDEDHFVKFLGACHRTSWTTKDENYLMSPAVFDPDKVPGTDRAKENIIFLRHVWLDFENGDLRPDQVPDLFPHFRMIITNTFQHTGEKPRFRVVIPTAQIMTLEVYSILYHSIGYKLEDAGYPVDRDKRSKARNEGKRKSGLDWSKATPTSLFYLPCQPEDPSQSFFKVYTGSDRLTLDPRTWVESSGFLIKAEAEEEAPSSNDDQKVNEAAVVNAIEAWRGSTAYPGEGGYRFFILALRLRSAGMDHYQIKWTLTSEASFGRSPNERKAQIPSIMNSLRRGRQ